MLGNQIVKNSSNIGVNQSPDWRLVKKLNSEIEGEVHFDEFSRGMYATDASIYQIKPLGIVVPSSARDLETVIHIAKEESLPLLMRGGGTSQGGQTVGKSIIVDTSKYLDKVLHLDVARQICQVEPGIVLDRLNEFLKPYGLWFPVDVSTGSRATIGGMVGNNSCGSRSIIYGTMRDNVKAIEAILADGSKFWFGEETSSVTEMINRPDLVKTLLKIGRDEAPEIFRQFPNLMRRVGGYNIDALIPTGPIRGDWGRSIACAPPNCPNLAHLLVGSEGTLAYYGSVELYLQPIPKNKVLGVCHFSSFFEAMETTKAIVELDPSAVELVDKQMIELSRKIPLFKKTVETFVTGEPASLLLVEFSKDDQNENIRRLKGLTNLINELGSTSSVIEVTEPAQQKAIWGVRKSALNIMMSMKGDNKPISFIEDCAVSLEDLPEYTDRLTEVFKKYNTSGTWYAHASVGCLHVRPILNLKKELDIKKMRSIAEEAIELVREYNGSHSGEHGDGLVRSEFHEKMFGSKIIRIFERIKRVFDPSNRMNPGKIVYPHKMDDPSLLRFKPNYLPKKIPTILDWESWGGFSNAIEMCNNNGACRTHDKGVMCPSYRVTRNEHDLTRGRANALRLAISGQLGNDAFTSKDMAETMKLCVGCKGCKKECPTGVDMARMKIEFLHHYNQVNPMNLREKIFAYLPRYAKLFSSLQWLLTIIEAIPGLKILRERILGISRFRSLPVWKNHAKILGGRYPLPVFASGKNQVALFVDTFNRNFEPENVLAAQRVLSLAGYNPILIDAGDQDRPLCCGRTFLSAGLVEQAREEMQRLIKTLLPLVRKKIPIIGLEPSCILTLRDELMAILPGKSAAEISSEVKLFEEFFSDQLRQSKLSLKSKKVIEKKVLVHGHCHQKALSDLSTMKETLELIDGLEVAIVDSSCCGMAGAFGYQAETYDTSMKMGELQLFPSIRSASEDTLIVANGTSCRQQISHGTQRRAYHLVNILERFLEVDSA